MGERVRRVLCDGTSRAAAGAPRAIGGRFRAGAPIRGPDHRHDLTPWAHHNRVLLCQATLSIGPYLLLKVQFQH